MIRMSTSHLRVCINLERRCSLQNREWLCEVNAWIFNRPSSRKATTPGKQTARR